MNGAQRLASWVNSGTARVSLWLVALSLTIWGLSGLVGVGVVADDLQILVEGAGVLWGGGGFVGLTEELTRNMISSSHVLPFAGVMTATTIKAVDIMHSAGVPLHLGWGIGRVLWILTAILAAAIATTTWQTLAEGRRSRNRLLSNYALLSAIVVSSIQVHALWSNDPVISYPTASWLIVFLGFLYIASIGRAWVSESSRRTKQWLITAGMIAVVGVLLYEMMIAAVAAGAIAVAGLLFIRPATRRTSHILWSASAVLIPVLAFGSTQWIRLLWPSWYTGTQSGYPLMVLPVLRAGLLGSLPLANTALTIEYTGAVSVDWPSALVVAAAASALVAIWAVTARRSTRGISLNRGLFLVLFVFVSAVLAFWFVSTLMFAMTSKYQAEVGVTVGKVYLFYAVGAISLAVTITLGFYLLALKAPKVAVFAALITLVPLGVVQASVNANVLHELTETATWSRRILLSLDDESLVGNGCAVLDLVVRPEISAEQEAAISHGLQKAYVGRFGGNLCD